MELPINNVPESPGKTFAGNLFNKSSPRMLALKIIAIKFNGVLHKRNAMNKLLMNPLPTSHPFKPAKVFCSEANNAIRIPLNKIKFKSKPKTKGKPNAITAIGIALLIHGTGFERNLFLASSCNPINEIKITAASQ